MSIERHLDKFDSCENLSIALSSKFARTWYASLRTRPLRTIVALSDIDFAFVSAGKKQSLFPAKFTSVPSRPPKRFILSDLVVIANHSLARSVGLL